MQALIDVFKMNEVSIESRIKIIRQLGQLLNHDYGANVSERLVLELVLTLDPNNEIKNDEHYKSYV